MPRTKTSDNIRQNRVSRAAAEAAIARAKSAPVKVKKRGAGAPLTAVDKGARSYTDTSTYEGAASVDPDKPLTLQMMEFAKNWAAGESIASAALRAGYSQESVGYRLIRMPNVIKVYEREKALYEAACQMTRKKVMDMQLEAFQMAKLMAEPSSMVSAAREIGRMCGYYEPVKHQIDVNVKGEVTVRQLNNMSDADLLKFISGGTPLQLTEDHE